MRMMVSVFASATGSISTDSTVGVLGSGNITGWQLNLDDGFGQIALNGTANSQLFVSGNGLSATASGMPPLISRAARDRLASAAADPT